MDPGQKERRLRRHEYRNERIGQFLQTAGAELVEGTGFLYVTAACPDLANHNTVTY